MALERINKILSEAGVASRRKADDLIAAGKVTINGQIATLGTRANPRRDDIQVDGKKIKIEGEHIYFLLHKPKGFICSNRRINQEKIVQDLVPPEVTKRLFTVGRLDKDTLGLILLTSDGAFAHKVIHPSSNLSKEYIAKVSIDITDAHLKILSEGLRIEGTWIAPHKVEKVRKGTISIVLKEGKKHEVRLLLEHAELPLIELKRVRLGPLLLGDLPLGHIRPLTPQEKALLKKE